MFSQSMKGWRLKRVGGQVEEPKLTSGNCSAIHEELSKQNELANDRINSDTKITAQSKLDELLKKVQFRWFVFKKKQEDVLSETDLTDVETQLNGNGTVATRLINFYSALARILKYRLISVTDLFNSCVEKLTPKNRKDLETQYIAETTKFVPVSTSGDGSAIAVPAQELIANIKAICAGIGVTKGSQLPSIEDEAADPPKVTTLELEKVKIDLLLMQQQLKTGYKITEDSCYEDEGNGKNLIERNVIAKNCAINLLHEMKNFILLTPSPELAKHRLQTWKDKICYLNTYQGLNNEIMRLKIDYLLTSKEESKELPAANEKVSKKTQAAYEKIAEIENVVKTRKEAIRSTMDFFSLKNDRQNFDYNEAKNKLIGLQEAMKSTGKNVDWLRGTNGLRQLSFFGSFLGVTGKRNIQSLIDLLPKEEKVEVPHKTLVPI